MELCKDPNKEIQFFQTTAYLALHGDEKKPMNVATLITDSLCTNTIITTWFSAALTFTLIFYITATIKGSSSIALPQKAQGTGIHTIHKEIMLNIWKKSTHTRIAALNQIVPWNRVRNSTAFAQLAKVFSGFSQQLGVSSLSQLFDLHWG
jgi:hypothetical protein